MLLIEIFPILPLSLNVQFKKLEAAGYKIFKTNSLDWWKNPKREARMLASKLIKADNTPAELQLALKD